MLERAARAGRRRRLVWILVAGAVVVAGVATAVSLTGGGGGPNRPALPPGAVHVVSSIDGAVQLAADTAPVTSGGNPAQVDRVARAEQAFAVALLDQLGHGGNVSVSPASLYLALGMLQNGARGATAQQIAAALQVPGLDTAALNAGLAGLTRELTAAAARDGITLDSANSLWQQRGFPLRTPFMAALAGYYRTGVWQVDYAHDMSGALKAIDDWTSRQTHGKITKLFDRLDPTTVLVLANAIYFHAAWATPFDPNATEDGTFTTGSGTRVTARFMSGGPGLSGAATADYQAVQLPYRGGRFAALAIMPTSGSLADFVRSLTPARIATIAAGLRPGTRVSLPRFTTTSTLDLVPTLRALGMHAAFSDTADFSALSPQPTVVGQAIQRVYLGVGEKGTTAAAVTGIAMQPTGARAAPEVVLNHPFLFLVRDTRTGAILFASQVQDPTAG